MRKIAEKRFIETARFYGWYTHKYGDVRHCIHCQGILPKSENMPDYAEGIIYTYVEAKNNNSQGRWGWYQDIGPEGKRKNQRKWIQKYHGWLYIVFKEGKPPEDESAFYIPWYQWANSIEPALLEKDQRTLTKTGARQPGADYLFAEYALSWEVVNGKGVFKIPPNHIYWELLLKKLDYERNLVIERMKG